MNTSRPDALMQGIALQHYKELIPEMKGGYFSNKDKMEAYKRAYARVFQQLQEATAIHLQQQPTPTWITLTQTGVRLQALTTLNYSMLAMQMRMNHKQALKNSTPKLSGGQTIHIRVPIQPANAKQQAGVQRTPTLVRTESRPLATGLEIMKTERQKGIEEMRAEQAKSPEPENPKAPVSTPDTDKEEKEEEKAKDKKEDQTQASTPNQETQGRNNGVEIVEHVTPTTSTEQPERRITRSQSRKKQKTEGTEFFHVL
jgi:hypothetical protein